MQNNEHTEQDTEVTSSNNALSIGQLIAGKYKIEAAIGSGGMGTVYRVNHIFLQKDYALKTMNASSISRTALQRFQLEATTASNTNHPNLVHVYDFGLLDNGQPYLVMDFVDGTSLADLLKKDGALDVQTAAAIFAQTCFGLLSAHDKGIVHRDIKPANIMLLNNFQVGAEGSVKVVDFGIAKLTSREGGEIQALTRTGEIFGSPLYMSPEQCMGGRVDHRSDIYSLGCVLFEMLTGTPPHIGQNALATMMLHDSGKIPTLKQASLGRKFSDEVERVVAKMLNRSPEHRYQNLGIAAHEFAAAVGREASKTQVQNHRIQNRDLTQEQNLNDRARVKGTTKNKPTDSISMTRAQLALVLSAAVLLSGALVGASCLWYTAQQRPQRLQNNQPQLLEKNSASTVEKKYDEQTENVTDSAGDFLDSGLNKVINTTDIRNKANGVGEAIQLAKTADITSEIRLGPDGTMQRCIKFPKFSLGAITQYNEQSQFDNGVVLGDAQGTRCFPKLQKITISMHGRGVEHIAAQDPIIFKQLNADDFYGLLLGNPYPSPTITLVGDQSANGEDERLAKLLSIAGTWRHLELLQLYGYRQCDKSVVALNRMKTLRYLFFSKCGFTHAEDARQPFLLNLDAIIAANLSADVVNVIVETLSRSKRLQRLAIPGSHCSNHVFAQLVRCPTLRYLQIDGTDLNEPKLSTINAMSSLTEVDLRGEHADLKTLKQVASCKHITRIILLAKSYSAEEQSILNSFGSQFVFTDQPS